MRKGEDAVEEQQEEPARAPSESDESDDDEATVAKASLKTPSALKGKRRVAVKEEPVAKKPKSKSSHQRRARSSAARK